jgi:hypothetical protein
MTMDVCVCGRRQPPRAAPGVAAARPQPGHQPRPRAGGRGVGNIASGRPTRRGARGVEGGVCQSGAVGRAVEGCGVPTVGGCFARGSPKAQAAGGLGDHRLAGSRALLQLAALSAVIRSRPVTSGGALELAVSPRCDRASLGAATWRVDVVIPCRVGSTAAASCRGSPLHGAALGVRGSPIPAGVTT